MEYDFTIKRNEVLTHASTWMNLETSHEVKEASHRKTIYFMMSFI